MKKTTSEPDSAALSARCHRSAAVYHRGVHVGSSFLSSEESILKKEDHKRTQNQARERPGEKHFFSHQQSDSLRSVTRSLRQHLLRVPPRVAPDGLAQIDRHPFLLVLAVPVRAVQQQQVHNLHVAPHRRPVQRGVISEVKRVHLGALLQEKLARLEVPVVRGSGQRGILHDAALLDVGALVDEELAAGGVAVAGGEEHGGIAAVVSLVEGRALIVLVSEWVR